MGLKVYFPLAVLASLFATVGADIIAGTAIAGGALDLASRGHLFGSAMTFVGDFILLAPFIAVAFLCARAEKLARSRGIILVFAVAMLALLYFYFQGHLGAQQALAEKKWTAASLSIGLLPFVVGVPVVLAVMGMGALAAKFDPRMSD